MPNAIAKEIIGIGLATWLDLTKRAASEFGVFRYSDTGRPCVIAASRSSVAPEESLQADQRNLKTQLTREPEPADFKFKASCCCWLLGFTSRCFFLIPNR